MFEDTVLPPKNLFFSQIKKRKARVQKVGKKKGEQQGLEKRCPELIFLLSVLFLHKSE